MIYPYIKVNKKVVDYLGIAADRYEFPDGNYLLWKFDLMTLGGNNDETLRRIGGLGMSSEQVRAEQKGGTPAPLPVAEYPAFRVTVADATVADDSVVSNNEPNEEDDDHE